MVPAKNQHFGVNNSFKQQPCLTPRSWQYYYSAVGGGNVPKERSASKQEEETQENVWKG